MQDFQSAYRIVSNANIFTDSRGNTCTMKLKIVILYLVSQSFDSFGCIWEDNIVRLLAVPFWIVERVREIAMRKCWNLHKRAVSSLAFSPHSNLAVLLITCTLSYFTRALNYPERDC